MDPGDDGDLELVDLPGLARDLSVSDCRFLFLGAIRSDSSSSTEPMMASAIQLDSYCAL